MSPEFAAVVAPVVRWAKAQGWRRVDNGVVYDADNMRLPFDVECVRLADRSWAYGVRALPVRWFGPDTPQQAVDVLAALGVLPPHLSSQWQAGRGMARAAACVLIPDALPDGVEGVQIGGRS